MPLAVVLVTIGMFLGRWPFIAYPFGALIEIGVLYYLYRAKQPWLYSYIVILIGVMMLLVGLLGVEI